MRGEEKVRFSYMRSATFFGLIGVLSIAVLYLFVPFFYPIFWAAVITIVFYPLYKTLGRYIKWQNVNSTLMLLVVLAVLIIPLILLSLLVVNESFKLFSTIGQYNIPTTENVSEGINVWAEKLGLVPYVEIVKEKWTVYAQSGSKIIGSHIVSAAKSITQTSAKFIFMFFVMLYALFFFFRDGEKMIKRVMHLSPLGDTYENMLLDRFTSTIRATLKGTFIVGGVQGIIGGILFWVTGVPGAFVWAVVMTAVAILPGVGPVIVWIPAAVLMLVFGHTWQGLTIVAVGAGVIGTIDNLLRPMIVGKDIEMHPVIVLFSTLGGILIFGISGFIIGPVIAALYMAVVSIYDHYYKNELGHN